MISVRCFAAIRSGMPRNRVLFDVENISSNSRLSRNDSAMSHLLLPWSRVKCNGICRIQGHRLQRLPWRYATAANPIVPGHGSRSTMPNSASRHRHPIYRTDIRGQARTKTHRKPAFLRAWHEFWTCLDATESGDGAYLTQIVDTTICFKYNKNRYHIQNTPICTP